MFLPPGGAILQIRVKHSLPGGIMGAGSFGDHAVHVENRRLVFVQIYLGVGLLALIHHLLSFLFCFRHLVDDRQHAVGID
jgi:hypothetical protein